LRRCGTGLSVSPGTLAALAVSLLSGWRLSVGTPAASCRAVRFRCALGRQSPNSAAALPAPRPTFRPTIPAIGRGRVFRPRCPSGTIVSRRTILAMGGPPVPRRLFPSCVPSGPGHCRRCPVTGRGPAAPVGDLCFGPPASTELTSIGPCDPTRPSAAGRGGTWGPLERFFSRRPRRRMAPITMPRCRLRNIRRWPPAQLSAESAAGGGVISHQGAGRTIVVATAEYVSLLWGSARAAIRVRGCAVGLRPASPGPGVHEITNKTEWPDWFLRRADMIERQAYLPRFQCGRPGNPLGGAEPFYLAHQPCTLSRSTQPSDDRQVRLLRLHRPCERRRFLTCSRTYVGTKPALVVCRAVRLPGTAPLPAQLP